MLWIYADNDLFFGPEVVQRLHQAFTSAGGSAELIKHPAFGKDGHALFALGIALWTPYVDAFLKTHRLVLRDSLLPVPVPNLAVPAGLGEKARAGVCLLPEGAVRTRRSPCRRAARSAGAQLDARVEEARKSALEILRQARARLPRSSSSTTGSRSQALSERAQPLVLACRAFMAVAT